MRRSHSLVHVFCPNGLLKRIWYFGKPVRRVHWRRFNLTELSEVIWSLVSEKALASVFYTHGFSASKKMQPFQKLLLQFRIALMAAGADCLNSSGALGALYCASSTYEICLAASSQPIITGHYFYVLTRMAEGPDSAQAHSSFTRKPTFYVCRTSQIYQPRK